MSESVMYRFTFDKPVKFKKVYNFLPLFASANSVQYQLSFRDVRHCVTVQKINFI